MNRQESDTASTEVLTLDLDEEVNDDYIKGFKEQKTGMIASQTSV